MQVAEGLERASRFRQFLESKRTHFRYCMRVGSFNKPWRSETAV